jgi:hypothetical protein
VGLTAVAEQGLAMLGVGGGLYLVGVARPDVEIALNIASAIGGQLRVQGVNFGSTNFKRDIPTYAELYLQGRMNLDDQVREGSRCATSMTATRRSRTARSRASSSIRSNFNPHPRRIAMKAITKHYIDGAFVESHGREVMDSINPTNGNVIARVTLGDEEDARRAIAAAKRAFPSFARTTKEDRANLLRRLHEVVSARGDDLTAAMVEEYGGVVRFAAPIVQAGASAFLAAEKALQELPLERSWGNTTVTLEPVGVAGLITPWNANALFLCAKLASAVAAGCTVVMKPSELSALQTQVWLECVHEARLSQGLCNVVTGRGDVVGAELVRNPDVAKISFTGSVGVGKTIMRDGAATMKRVTLELGEVAQHPAR